MAKKKHAGQRKRGRSKLARQILYLTRGTVDLPINAAEIARVTGHGKDTESVERALNTAAER